MCNKPLPPYLEDSVQISSESTKTLNTSKLNTTIPTGFNKPTGLTQFSTNQMTQLPKQRDLYDTCFHLIKLYCVDKYPIADIVSPLCHTSNQLDYRLSWHLTMALLSLNYNFIAKECLETLHESYATQLQSFGLWHWSIFVFMHIDDENRWNMIKLRITNWQYFFYLKTLC